MCSEEERQLTQRNLCQLDRHDLCDKVEEEWERLSLADSEAVEGEEVIELTPEKVSEILIGLFPEKKMWARVTKDVGEKDPRYDYC